MNVDSGLTKLWKDLTPEEQESGRWIKLTEGENAVVQEVEPRARVEALAAFLKDIPQAERRFT